MTMDISYYQPFTVRSITRAGETMMKDYYNDRLISIPRWRVVVFSGEWGPHHFFLGGQDELHVYKRVQRMIQTKCLPMLRAGE